MSRTDRKVFVEIRTEDVLDAVERSEVRTLRRIMDTDHE